MPEHLHTGAMPGIGAHCCVGDSSFRLQSMFERMPEHRHDFDHTAHRVGLNIWPMVCRESGLALLVLACTGLLAECRQDDMLQ